jgi:hypothetical protein
MITDEGRKAYFYDFDDKNLYITIFDVDVYDIYMYDEIIIKGYKYNLTKRAYDKITIACTIIIDYGGIALGTYNTMMSTLRELIKPIQEKPNTLFIIWTETTMTHYLDIIEEDAEELLEIPNVLLP